MLDGDIPRAAGSRWRERSFASPLHRALLTLTPLDNAFHKRRLSPEALDAMERTVTGLVGALPRDQFRVRMETSREDLAKLLTSAVCTGYMLHNVERRYSLSRGLEVSSTSEPDKPALEDDAPAAPSDADATLELSAEALAAAPAEVAAHLEALQARLAATEARLAAAEAAAARAAPSGTPPNALLSYLRALQESHVTPLSGTASPQLHAAVTELISRLLGRLPPSRRGAGSLGGGALPGLDGAVGALGGPSSSERLRGGERPEFSSTVSMSREYTSSLLLWALGAGHYAAAVEQRAFLEARFAAAERPHDHALDPFLGLDGAA